MFVFCFFRVFLGSVGLVSIFGFRGVFRFFWVVFGFFVFLFGLEIGVGGGGVVEIIVGREGVLSFGIRVSFRFEVAIF